MVNICEATIQNMKNAKIKSSIVRAVWASVSAINAQILLQLSDSDLIHQIFREVDHTSALSSEDRQSLIDYISSRIMLIRDIAES